MLVALIDPKARDLVVDGLRSRADTLRRAATKAAAQVEAEREAGKRDIRSQAVSVTNLLVDASRLDEAADAIAKAAPAMASAVFDVAATASPAPEARAEVADAATAPTPRPAPAADQAEAGPRRSQAEAIAEAAQVIAALDMRVDLSADVDLDDLPVDDDVVDDGSTPEDTPTPDELAELAPPQES